MKRIVFLVCLLGASLQASESTVTGDWSPSVRGLRGRLLYSEDPPFNGTRMAAIYLELQNAPGTVWTLVNFPPPRLDLVDSNGKSIPSFAGDTADIMITNPYTIVLPSDSQLRFRVSISGYGIPKNAGLAIQLNSGVWIAPTDDKNERYLVGSFSVPTLPASDFEGRRKDMALGSVWRGTLTLPRLRIPSSLAK